MPISKSIRADNGVTVTFHRAVSLQVDLLANTALVLVNSHADEASALAGLPLAWQWPVAVPVESLAGDQPTLLAEIENALVAADGSPFNAGALVTDPSDTLEAAQTRAWSNIKATRARLLTGNFTYDGGVYQINTEQVTGAVLGAKIAKDAGAPFSQDWTLFDNSVRTLTADQVIAMGVTMLTTIAALFDTARDLRAQIYAPDATIDSIAAVTWPAPAPETTPAPVAA